MRNLLKTTTLAACLALGMAITAADAAPRSAPSSVRHPGHAGPGHERPRPDRPGDNVGNGNRINIGNDIDIDIDTDPDWDRHHRHPVATAVAVTSAVAIGTRVYVLPTGCTTSHYAGVTYYYCGSSWYRPYYYGTSITYVVVTRPY